MLAKLAIVLSYLIFILIRSFFKNRYRFFVPNVHQSIEIARYEGKSMLKRYRRIDFQIHEHVDFMNASKIYLFYFASMTTPFFMFLAASFFSCYKSQPTHIKVLFDVCIGFEGLVTAFACIYCFKIWIQQGANTIFKTIHDYLFYLV